MTAIDISVLENLVMVEDPPNIGLQLQPKIRFYSE